MDKLSSDILRALKEDSRLSVDELSAMTGADKATVSRAITELERSGVIVKYSLIVNEDKEGSDIVEALIEVKVSPQHSKGFDSFAEEIYMFDEVRSVYLMSGAYDLAVFVTGKSLKQVALFVSEKLSVMDKVLSTATHFILKKYKSDGVVLGNTDYQRLAVNP